MPSITLLRLKFPLNTAEAVQQLIGCKETLHVAEATRNKDSDGEDNDFDNGDENEDDSMIDGDAERYEYAGTPRQRCADEVDSDDGDDDISFVRLTPEQEVTLRARLAEVYPNFEPVMFSVFDAGHALHVSHPERMMKNGKDPTMPQHRPAFSPAAAFPIWYFFYGTLAEPEILAKVLETDDIPPLKAASVKGYKLGKMESYKVLEEVEDAESKVDGWAFSVANEEDATKLAIYETGAYASVDVRIQLEDGECIGRTFVRS